MADIDLSIYITTYNQEKYIAEALDSVLMQKTSYTYEVLIGEDCSQDGTADILREYEKKYPERFQVFYRKENMHGKVPNNGMDLRNRCRGRYAILLEGDDFWTDPDKIEKQIRFLDTHPEYIAVAHKCVVVGEDSKPIDDYKYYEIECWNEDYTFKDYCLGLFPGQTATLMYRNILNSDNIDSSILNKGLVPGDKLKVFVLLCYGEIYCMPEVMSAYRHVKTHGTSYSATTTYNFQKRENWGKNLVEYARKRGKSPEECAEFVYFEIVFRALLKKKCTFREFLNDCSCIRYKGYILAMGIRKVIYYCKRSVQRRKRRKS